MSRDTHPQVAPQTLHNLRERIAQLDDPGEQLHLLRQAIDAMNNTVTVSDPNLPDNPLVYVNEGFERLTGYERQDILGKNCRFLQGNDDNQDALDTLRTAIVKGESTRVELRNYRKDGSMFWNELYLTPVYGKDERLKYFLGVQNDVTELRELWQSERNLRNVMGGHMAFVAVLSPGGEVLTIDPSTLEGTGIPAEEVLGQPLDETFWWSHNEEVRRKLREAIGQAKEGETRRFDTTMRQREGHVAVDLSLTPRFDAGGVSTELVVTGLDITERKGMEEDLEDARRTLEAQVVELEETKEELQRANAQLYQGAFYDGLTGLPNRTLFLDRLEHVLKQQVRHPERSAAILFLDFDRFKWVNDSLGHEVGDLLLKEVAERLKTCVREADTVARLGGDEFTVLLEEVNDPQQPLHVAERVREAFAAPVDVEGKELHTSASIGIVTSTQTYDKASEVVRDADIAMYRAKERGGATYQVFSQRMHDQVVETVQLEAELREALRRGQFRVVYHPIFTAQDRRLVGFEALLRWQHPTRGLLLPKAFLKLAYETGLIIAIDRFVWGEACTQITRWQRRFAQPLRLTLNLSTQQFYHPDLPEVLKTLLRDTGANPSTLGLEITEQTLLESSSRVTQTLAALKAFGFKLYLDDFGTGYSSLSYLQRFPLDVLKVDQSFVESMTRNEESAELVRTILSMAQNLGLRSVAEGVETEAQLTSLRELGCEQVQGFLFAKPLSPEEAEAFITAM